MILRAIDGWTLVPKSEVTVLYNYVAVLKVPEPELVMEYRCLFTVPVHIKFVLSGEAEVN